MSDLKNELLNPYNIGHHFVEEREKKGWTVEEVAKRTRMHPDIIRKIEKDEFEKLPGHIYARSYVSIYAKALGLSGKTFVEMLEGMQEDDVELDQFRAEDLEFLPQKSQPPAVTAEGFGMFIISGILVVALLIASYGTIKVYQVWPAITGDANLNALKSITEIVDPDAENSGDPDQVKKAKPAKAQPATAPKAKAVAAAVIGAHKLELRAESSTTEDQRWVRVEAFRGTTKVKIYEGLLPQGQIYPSAADAWVADKFMITLRSAEKVDIIFDGFNYGKYDKSGYQKISIPAAGQ